MWKEKTNELNNYINKERENEIQYKYRNNEITNDINT